jgi:hypothetical protein
MRPRILPNILAICAIALLALLLTGCSRGSGSNNNGDFTINFTGFTPHLGEMMYLKVVDTTTNSVAGTMAPRVVAADAFSVVLPDIIRQGDSFQIDFGVDVDSNGALDRSPIGTPAGIDHTWRISDSATDDNLVRNFAHDTNWTDITPF